MHFPDQRDAILHKFKEIKGLRVGVRRFAAQGIPRIDAEMMKKGLFWMETP